MIVDYKDIDSYGDYTVERWFSAGELADKQAETFAEKGCGRSFTIMGFGLPGEVGEVIEYLKKLVRDNTLDHDHLKKELGDVIFYWARICRYFGFQPSEVIAANVKKLECRVERGTMRGSGNDR